MPDSYSLLRGPGYSVVLEEVAASHSENGLPLPNAYKSFPPQEPVVKRRTLLKAGGIVGVPAALGVGVAVFPIRPHLYDVRLDNRRAEPVTIDVRLEADDTTVLESTIDVPPDELLHLSCEWPRAAWTYEMAIRPTDQNEWQTITWTTAGKLCKKLVINEAGNSVGPVSFYDSSCPTTLDEHSCE